MWLQNQFQIPPSLPSLSFSFAYSVSLCLFREKWEERSASNFQLSLAILLWVLTPLLLPNAFLRKTQIKFINKTVCLWLWLFCPLIPLLCVSVFAHLPLLLDRTYSCYLFVPLVLDLYGLCVFALIEMYLMVGFGGIIIKDFITIIPCFLHIRCLFRPPSTLMVATI